MILDGVHIGDHCLIVALGIAADGQKHALGLWDGSTENATICQNLLANLQSRGLRTDRSLLVILDGSKALRRAMRATFGEAALVQRCQIHKSRNVLDHLPERQRPWVQAILRRAYRSDVPTARRLLHDLTRRLDSEYPSAAEGVREGLEETLTVMVPGVVGPAAAVADLDQCRREPDQPHAARETERQTLARWEDDAPLGGRGCPRGGQRIPAVEGIPRYAEAGRRAAHPRSAARTLDARGC